MKLKIEIVTDNDAFQDCAAAECSRILAKLARDLEYGDSIGDVKYLYDVNGNKVGEVRYIGRAPRGTGEFSRRIR